MTTKLNVQSIFNSIDGEANGYNGAGELCTFIRLKGCPLRCRWCDTTYAQESKPENWIDIDEIVKQVCFPKVTITGGDGLFQGEKVVHLIRELRKIKKKVSVETNGSFLIPFDESGYGCFLSDDKHVRWVVDWKLPSSAMEKHMKDEVFSSLRDIDVIKFVIADEKDYKRACNLIKWYPGWKAKKVFSPMLSVYTYACCRKSAERCLELPPGVDMTWPRQLVEMMLRDKVPAQFSLQLHKLLWPGAKEER